MITIGLMPICNCSDFPDALFSLIDEIKLDYHEPPKVMKPGRPPTFSDLSFLLLAVVAVVTQTFSDAALRRLLEKDEALREALGFPRVPDRTSLRRRLKKLVPISEQQITLTGRTILEETAKPEEYSQVSAIDGRMYQAAGPRWQAKDRRNGTIPTGLRNVDCESTWSKSNYRNWVQGYRLMIQTLVFPSPVPIFAVWRENSLNEAKVALEELTEKRLPVTDVMLGDTTFGKEDFAPEYRQAGGYLLTPKQLPEDRRLWKNDLYEYRRESIELLFQRIIQAFELKVCPVKGEGKNGAFVLASVWAYQICWLSNYRKKRIRRRLKKGLKMLVGGFNCELCTPFSY